MESGCAGDALSVAAVACEIGTLPGYAGSPHRSGSTKEAPLRGVDGDTCHSTPVYTRPTKGQIVPPALPNGPRDRAGCCGGASVAQVWG